MNKLCFIPALLLLGNVVMSNVIPSDNVIPSEAEGSASLSEADRFLHSHSPVGMTRSQCSVGMTPPINDSLILARQTAACPASCLVPDTLTMVFIGDIMLHSAQIENTARPDGTFDFSGYFPDIKDDLSRADIAVANMEFTLAGPPYSGYPAFCAPDAYAEYMAGCGIDVFLTANNHILDKGESGLVRTLEKYREMERNLGIRMTGSAENPDSAARNMPLIVRSKDFTIAFINCTYGTNLSTGKKFPGTYMMSDRETVSAAFDRAEKAGADLIVALPHWGIEYDLHHSAGQEEYAVWLAGQGADIIIGAHPHVVQDADTLTVMSGNKERKVPVIYSLGNAISNMSAPNTQVGLMLTVKAVERPCGVHILPPEYEFLWCSLPGRLSRSHTTVKIAGHIGKKEEWTREYEYGKMLSTYREVLKQTGLKPENNKNRHRR